MRPAAMPGTEAATGDTDVARQARKTGDGSTGLPAISALVHGTATENDHGRSRRSVTSG